MENRIRELQDLISRYGSFAARHNEQFADVEVHKGCSERMEKIIEKWRQELATIQQQAAGT